MFGKKALQNPADSIIIWETKAKTSPAAQARPSPKIKLKENSFGRRPKPPTAHTAQNSNNDFCLP
jgi:hypothetical protein